ncbi:MAG TPA: DUF1657 domain-containing protein [Bacillota bacterium]|jgi:hypothetical protein|nr:DUF1657 domain-containing protein [Peptococcaceae bacterium MAG4]NLW38633.1 DUF1657 domain-containing protein [Peptococcaceae bacterium]HPU35477.1 DUF1657 domain-containing protein [Bacillota bacterium]HPZ43943.1 DUF1657 domain-containing protein [Bacillota bacterium]HQD76431.1 DUF1657 domain-containing protein [Bacillota bacterium]
MTVSSQVKQTLASLKSAQANLESFALQTQNQKAKELYSSAARQAKALVDSLEHRIAEIENEEPQYRGYQ